MTEKEKKKKDKRLEDIKNNCFKEKQDKIQKFIVCIFVW